MAGSRVPLKGERSMCQTDRRIRVSITPDAIVRRSCAAAPGKRRFAVSAILLLACAGLPLAAQEGDERPRAVPDNTTARPTQVQPNGAPARVQPMVRQAPAGGQPRSGTRPQPTEGEVILPVLAEALELRALVEYVAETLEINIAASDELTGSVVLNAPMRVRRDDLLELLDSMLEHQGFTIVPDRMEGWYRVVRVDGVSMQFRGERPTTRIIPTPTVRPSALSDVINNLLGGAAAPGQQAGRPGRIAYLDELGVIVITDSPRRIDMLVELVTRVLDRSAEQQFLRFDLQHIAASVARQRVLELIGTQTPTIPGFPPGVQPGGPAAAAAAASTGAGGIDHLANRLTADQQGNALILRGFPEEAARVEGLLRVIDVPHQLEPRQYFAGSAAAQIAQMAERFGFGRVETMETPTGAPTPFPQIQIQQQGRAITFPQQQQTGAGGGPVLVVDAARGMIIYYGTQTQHRSLEALIGIFEADRELVEIRSYKIMNLQAADVADILNGLVFGTQPVGTSAFLPGAGGAAGQQRTQPGGTAPRTTPATQQQRNPFGQRSDAGNISDGIGVLGGQGEAAQVRAGTAQAQQPAARTPQGMMEGAGGLGGEDVFILADRFNNQVLVKAPARQQEEFSQLISKLDQRRPQVFIEVQIISVSATDDFRLAFETQLINANGRGGVINTNFGLSGNPAADDILDRKIVPLALSGFTGALIRTDQVPIIINALRREADTRILSSPRLLVDDNEVAEIVSLELQPTRTLSQGAQGQTLEGFGGFEEAGTRLTVTPSISGGGYLRLQYAIELSNFVGVGTGAIPAPKQTREINSDSVTIPADTTIVVGGIEVDSQNKTVLKVPLLGDIPLVGHLFRDTGKSDASTRLYVFITPRIMRDPNFRDLILLTRGPKIDAGVEDDLPPLSPVMIELIEPTAGRRGTQPAEPSNPSPFDPYPRQPARAEDPTEN